MALKLHTLRHEGLECCTLQREAEPISPERLIAQAWHVSAVCPGLDTFKFLQNVQTLGPLAHVGTIYCTTTEICTQMGFPRRSREQAAQEKPV